MRNLMKVTALVLCMMLCFPAALAQEVAFKAGRPTMETVVNALASGKLVTAQLEFDLELNAQALGMTQEEAQLTGVILDAVRQADVTVGAGAIGDGVRLAAKAELTDAQGANPVSVSALADVTLDGIAVESDLIAGKRVSAKWETILALCGVDQSEIDMIMGLRNVDPDQVIDAIEEAAEQIEPMLEMAAQLAVPYAQTVVGFIQSLPIEIRENLTEEDYPPTAMEVSVTFTQKDLGTLIGLLCDQLDADASLKIMLNSLLAQADADVNVEEILSQARLSASGMTETDTPVTLYLGMNENDVPLYIEVYVYNEPTAESIYGGLFCYQDTDGVWRAEVMGGMYDAEGNAYGTGYLGGGYLGDATDPNVCSLMLEIYAAEGETPLMEMVYTQDTFRAEDSELPAYDTEMSMSLYIADGEEGMQGVSGANSRHALTAAGGESVVTTATTDMYSFGVTISQTQSMEQLIEPTADGGLSGYTKSAQTMPASGINKLEMNVVYASEDIDMAASQALVQVPLETATENEVNGLLTDAMTVLSNEKLPAVMTNLPAELVQMIQENAAQ